MNCFTLSFLYRNLAPYLKAVFTSGADHDMFALRARETKHGLAFFTFAIDVSLSVSEFIFTKLKEVAEDLVFVPSFCDILREHSIKHKEYHQNRNGKVCDGENWILPENSYDRVYYNHHEIGPGKHVSELIRAVSAVHETVELVFKLTHL